MTARVKTHDEKPTVGIILCKKKHDALVEITLPKGANIFANSTAIPSLQRGIETKAVGLD